MKRNLWQLAGTLGFLLSGCLATEQSAGLQEGGEAFMALTSTSEAVYSEVEAIFETVKEQRDQLCPRDEELHEQIRTELEAAGEDRAAHQEIFEKYRAELEADKAAMESCIGGNQDVWAELDRVEKELKRACFPAPRRGKKNGRGPRPPERMAYDSSHSSDEENAPAHRPPHPHPKPDFTQMSSEELARWEESLSSDACAAALEATTLPEV